MSVLTGFHVSCILVAYIRAKSAYTGEVIDLSVGCKGVGGMRAGENTRVNTYLK